jgi:hypothetical protein
MFRFTIRDLLWLMVVAGMGVGWWLTSRESTALRAQNGELLRQNNHYVDLIDRIWFNKKKQ